MNPTPTEDAGAIEERLRIINETLEERIAERTAVAEQRAAQLRSLTAELTQVEQRERRRLAQVLHDQLQQLLVAARLKIGTASHRVLDEGVQQLLRQIDELLEQALAESRSLTLELSPTVLYEAGLGPALQWLAQQMTEKHGLSVRVHLDPEACSVTEATRVLLFQAVRELLFNVVKHAQADQAELTLRKLGEDQVQVVVADTGLGFDPDRLEGRGLAGGFGLFSVRERLEAIGGRLEMTSAPGEGTCVSLQVPRGPVTLAGVSDRDTLRPNQ